MLDIMKKAAEKAGERILFYYGKTIKTTEKTSHQNLVTVADIESQSLIRQIILNDVSKLKINKKEVGFIGEENLASFGKHQFIIDPLDGTHNFAAHFPYFCISIGYMYERQIQTGLVYYPLLKTFYIAQKGKGAYKLIDNEKIPLTTLYKPLKQCLVVGYYVGDPSTRKRLFTIFKNLYPFIHALRAPGALALDLAFVGESIFNICIGNACIWDFSASQLIIEEAGGTLVDWSGKKLQYDFNNPAKSYQILACHPKLLPEVLDFFR